MANASILKTNWYRRYKVRAVDMTIFQQAMLDTARGASEGVLGAAVLSGLEIATPGGMLLDFGPGIAQGATGQLMVSAASGEVALSAPASGGQPAKALVVSRPVLTPLNLITRPTNPFDPVPLNEEQDCEVVVIQGAASANPEYPSKEANDAVLCGVLLTPGMTDVTEDDLDFSMREIPGVNTPVLKNLMRSDDRLRPYRNAGAVLGVTPSQTFGSNPKMFLETGKGQPSIYPKSSAGAFNPSDSFLDFSSGAISGGDEVSSPFTPQTPTGDNAIVATVVLNTSDTVAVLYGTQGTFAQCLEGIRSQKVSGPGSISPAVGTFKIAYVIVRSFGGAISDLFVIDARSLGAPSTGGGSAPVFTEATLADNQASPADVTGFLLNNGVNNGFMADYSITRRATTADSASVGLPDSTFEGNIVTGGGADATVRAIAHLSDNSVVLGGSFVNLQGFGSARLGKLNADGTYNASFISTVGSVNGAVFSVLRLSSGSLLFGGQFTAVGAATPHRLCKVDASGNKDATFNSNIGNPGFNNVVNAIAEQTDNKILVGGGFGQLHANGCQGIARLNSDGTEDVAFTANAGTGFDGSVFGLALQANGQILVVGSFTTYNGVTVTPNFARLNSDGTLDTAFVALVGVVGFDSDVLVVWEDLSNGAIFFAGSFTNFNGVANAYACRIDSTSGALDTTFRTNMSSGAGLNAAVACGAIQSDGKYLLGGAFGGMNGNSVDGYGRLNADGTNDATFEGNQTVGIDSGAVLALSTSPNFKIAIGGTFGQVNGATSVRIFQFDRVAGADVELREVGSFYGSYDDVGGAWGMTDAIGGGFNAKPPGFGPGGVNLSITAGGQLQYVSSLLGGTPTKSSMRFMIRGL